MLPGYSLLGILCMCLFVSWIGCINHQMVMSRKDLNLSEAYILYYSSYMRLWACCINCIIGSLVYMPNSLSQCKICSYTQHNYPLHLFSYNLESHLLLSHTLHLMAKNQLYMSSKHRQSFHMTSMLALLQCILLLEQQSILFHIQHKHFGSHIFCILTVESKVCIFYIIT